MDFPLLYGLPSNGKKIKEWSIKVSENEDKTANIITKHGYQNCKMQENVKNILKGKNIGRSNETTALQQAINEAQSKWKKQTENGYKESIEEIENNEIKILPMLAHDFNKRGKDINFPCFAQPKLDGVRLIAKINGPNYDDITFMSRTGKLMKNLDHIQNDIFKNIKSQIYPLYLDGELFTFDLPFEEISGIFRKLEKDQNIMKLQMHIFDMFYEQSEMTFSERYSNLCKMNFTKTKHLRLVETIECKTKDDIDILHGRYIEESFEGLILRNINGLYKPNYRSKDLQKYKEFQDDEFEIIGGQSGEGLEKDCVIFTCINNNNQKFCVRPRGSREIRKEYLKNIKKIIGKKLTVRYQNLSENGIVRFPVGIAIRDYE